MDMHLGGKIASSLAPVREIGWAITRALSFLLRS